MWKIILTVIAVLCMTPAAYAKGGADVPKINAAASATALTTIYNTDITFASLWAEQPAVIVFYRGGWCPICNRHLREMQAELKTIEGLGATLIAISPELPTHAQITSISNKLNFTVLTDKHNALSKELDLLWEVPAEKQEGFSSWLQDSKGKSLKDYNDQDSYTLPIPATYIIDTDGTILYSFIDPDYTKRAAPADVIAVLKSLQDAKE